MLSIVISSYNQAEYLPDAIESALIQNKIQPVEVIVVDDGSMDNSLNIARGYLSFDVPLKVISQVNKGLASARNTGIMNAKGDWILPLDADDILKDNYVKRILDELVFLESVQYREVVPDIIAPSFKCFGIGNEEIILMPNPTLEDFRTGNRIGYCSAIRKSVLLECGGYDPAMIWGYEDMMLWCDLLSRGKKIATIPEVLWLYRTKPESMWTKAKEHHQELLNIINKKVSEAKLNF